MTSFENSFPPTRAKQLALLRRRCLYNFTTKLFPFSIEKLILRYVYFTPNLALSIVHQGENVLHMAIVNEDPSMVKFLLDSGANYHERCCGSFMGAEDQKASRTDTVEHEWLNLQSETNYEGFVCVYKIVIINYFRAYGAEWRVKLKDDNRRVGVCRRISNTTQNRSKKISFEIPSPIIVQRVILDIRPL